MNCEMPHTLSVQMLPAIPPPVASIKVVKHGSTCKKRADKTLHQEQLTSLLITGDQMNGKVQMRSSSRPSFFFLRGREQLHFEDLKGVTYRSRPQNGGQHAPATFGKKVTDGQRRLVYQAGFSYLVPGFLKSRPRVASSRARSGTQ